MKRSLAFVLSVLFGLLTMPALTYAVQFDAVAMTTTSANSRVRRPGG